MNKETVDAIRGEQDYQQRRWAGHKHTVGEWLLVVEKCLNDAKRQWAVGHEKETLDELRQVAASAASAMDENGAVERTHFAIGCCPGGHC